MGDDLEVSHDNSAPAGDATPLPETVRRYQDAHDRGELVVAH
jgi:hypothetical protein